MKSLLLSVCICLFPVMIFAQDFQKIKENMSKAEVVRLLGNPTKKLKGDDPKNECYVWFKKDSAWIVYFAENKTTGSATSIEDLLKGLLNLASAFSNLNSDSTITPAASTLASKGGLDTQNAQKEQAVKDLLQVEIVDAKIIETWGNDRKAGCRFKIKNNSETIVYGLDITVYFYDKDGKVFFEQTLYPVNSASWTNKTILKPNYSILYPSGENEYMTADGMYIDEWDEGKIKVEISKVNLQQQ